MTVLERAHGRFAHPRRAVALSKHVAAALPPNVRVLDVGCGDGFVSRLITDSRPDVEIQGIDVHVRTGTQVPVAGYDGIVIPYGDASFDVVMFVDVLHHTDDPVVLLNEARRVAQGTIVIKDHTCDGVLARPTLRFMDRVGNARFGVDLPYNYWRRERWFEAFEALDLRVVRWKQELGLYPGPANRVFGRSLHFIAVLEPRIVAARSAGRRWLASGQLG
jgi:SAM-dependent methyltransferase